MVVLVGEEEVEMKVAAAAAAVVVVRAYDQKKDCRAVEEVERRCEVGPSTGGELSLYTDLLGDPISRVRNSPAYLMLVAEIVMMNKGDNNNKDQKREMVGMIRGCIKTVTRGRKYTKSGVTKHDDDKPISTKLAYILGLRVSPSHRRMGIGLKLVCGIEQWFKENGAEYSYMATENDNHASIKLFTQKCGYSKFRTPSILVQPVYAHSVRVSSRVMIVKLSPSDAETLYRRRFSTTEFFPNDIDSILHNNLNLGTYVAFRKGRFMNESWPGSEEFLASEPDSWAVVSVWNCMDVFKLEVRGASRLKKVLAKTSRLVDRVFPWLQLPSVPDIFSPFGIHFLYGLGGNNGPESIKLMKALCWYAHNLAKQHGCSVVATEVASQEPLKLGVPHWKKLSCAEDLWCIKRLGVKEEYSSSGGGGGDDDGDDWTKSPPGRSLFVDPREI